MMGASCCTVTQSTEKATPSKKKKYVTNFKFSHAFAIENQGKIDEVYDVSKTILGEGTAGMVYKATHMDLGFERAVKSIPTIDADELPPEVLVLRATDHPNIVKLYETFQDAKRTYLVMELCSGGELLEAVMRASVAGEFTEQQAATYLEQILCAINYIHSNDIVHRDIRIENFLLKDQSERAEVKLIDFGQSAPCDDKSSLSTAVGCAHYRAPEVIQGRYSKKIDIWSCGVLLFVMLSGSPPFDGDDDEQIFKAIQESNADFSGTIWSDVTQCAKEFLGMMLIKDPYRRSSAEALIKHQFIRRGDVAGKQPLPSVVKKIQAFKTASSLKKVCLTVIAKQLSRKQVDDLHLYFKTLDKNGDGTISKSELVNGLKKVGKAIPGMDNKQIGAMMSTLDSDGSGSIDYTEFIAAALDRALYENREVAWAAFRTFDKDNSGQIDKAELRQVLENMGQVDISNEKVTQLMTQADRNQDGHVDFEEFMLMIMEE